MRVPKLIFGLVAVALLSGCIAQTPGTLAKPPESSSSPSASAASTAPISWLIDFNAVGPFTIRGSFSAEAGKVAPYSRESPTTCPSSVASAFSHDGSPSVLVRVAGTGSDVISNIFVSRDAAVPEGSGILVATARGIGISSSESNVIAAYPDAIKSAQPGFNAYWLGNGEARHLVFRVRGGIVDGISLQADQQYYWDYCGTSNG